MAHLDEPPHQDLRCWQIQLFPSLVVKELMLERVSVNIFFSYRYKRKCLEVYDQTM